ncbi:MAG: hypothetical protein KDE63_10420 [Novosphingobium sp.]|nr:hypothetical protein [Novosphingobium sp.]
MPKFVTIAILFILASVSTGAQAQSQDREVPYWASIKVDKVNMRVGPSESYPIKWVYLRNGLPLKVLRVQEGWRLVQDPDGATGWLVARFLSLRPMGIVTGKAPAPMRAGPSADAALMWQAEPGVVGELGNCEAGWCRFTVEGRKAWIGQNRIWGQGADGD